MGVATQGTTRIAKCDNACVSAFQDEKYGKNMRVFNPAFGKGAHNRRYRCTVCKKEKELSNVQS